MAKNFKRGIWLMVLSIVMTSALMLLRSYQLQKTVASIRDTISNIDWAAISPQLSQISIDNWSIDLNLLNTMMDNTVSTINDLTASPIYLVLSTICLLVFFIGLILIIIGAFGKVSEYNHSNERIMGSLDRDFYRNKISQQEYLTKRKIFTENMKNQG